MTPVTPLPLYATLINHPSTKRPFSNRKSWILLRSPPATYLLPWCRPPVAMDPWRRPGRCLPARSFFSISPSRFETRPAVVRKVLLEKCWTMGAWCSSIMYSDDRQEIVKRDRLFDFTLDWFWRGPDTRSWQERHGRLGTSSAGAGADYRLVWKVVR